MSDQPAPQLHEKYDATFAARLEAGRQLIKDNAAAALAVIDGLEAEYVSKVVNDLRPQRDEYRTRVAELEKQLSPASPSKPVVLAKIFTKRTFDANSLSKEMKALYDSSRKDAQRQIDGPMQKAKKGEPPYADPVPYFGMHSWRWYGHTLLQPLFHAKMFGEVDQLEQMADVILGILAHAPTDNGPLYKATRLKDVVKDIIEDGKEVEKNKLVDDRQTKGVRRFWRGAPGKDFDQSDWSGLEMIHAGIVALAYVAFNDLRDVSPTFTAAADDCKKYMGELKVRMGVLTRVLAGPDKPWWFWNTTILHTLAHVCAYCRVMWKYLGDESAKAGYEYYSNLITSHSVYAKTAAGIEVVNLPHQPTQRGKDLGYADYFKRPAGDLGGAEDFTYVETVWEALWCLYWTGCEWTTPRFLSAYARTALEAGFPEGKKVGTMAEAICGGVTDPGKGVDQQEVMVIRGKEIVKTPGIRANRTKTRQANSSGRRAGALSGTVFTGELKYLPELADLRQHGTYAVDTWALGLLAHQAHYPLLEQVTL